MSPETQEHFQQQYLRDDGIDIRTLPIEALSDEEFLKAYPLWQKSSWEIESNPMNDPGLGERNLWAAQILERHNKLQKEKPELYSSPN